MDREYTGKGQGNYNTVAGSAGIASFLGLNARNILGGGADGYNHPPEYQKDRPVTEAQLELIREIENKNSTIASQASEIALRDATTYTLDKLGASEDKLTDKMEKLEDKIFSKIEKVECKNEHRYEKQVEINTQQAVYNGANNAALNCLSGQVAEVMALTKRVVPNSSVCPGYGDVKVEIDN